MEKEIITKDDLSNAGSKTKTSYVFVKLKKGMGQLPSLIKLAASLSKGSSAKKLYGSIPESYDRQLKNGRTRLQRQLYLLNNMKKG